MKSPSGAGSADLLVGVNPVLEQLRREPGRLEKVIVAQGAGGRALEALEGARRAGVAVAREHSRRLDALAGGVPHQGIVAVTRGFEYADWDDILAGGPACILLADQVSDPRNLGAIVRTAEATGVGGVVVLRDRAAGVSPAVAKASAGATALMPIAQVVNLSRALEELKGAGYWVVGLDGEAPRTVFDFRFPERCALVVGAEGKGLRSLTRQRCDHLVSIPMRGRIESLNVSVAAGVALYERLRQAAGGLPETP